MESGRRICDFFSALDCDITLGHRVEGGVKIRTSTQGRCTSFTAMISSCTGLDHPVSQLMSRAGEAGRGCREGEDGTHEGNTRCEPKRKKGIRKEGTDTHDRERAKEKKIEYFVESNNTSVVLFLFPNETK